MYKNNLQSIRKMNHISQDKLADALGVSRRTIGQIENGQQNPSLGTAYRIANYFQLQVTEVFPEESVV